jgi:hypothetical protein
MQIDDLLKLAVNDRLEAIKDTTEYWLKCNSPWLLHYVIWHRFFIKIYHKHPATKYVPPMLEMKEPPEYVVLSSDASPNK